jgi:uncharacterized protein (TIRG00374 family)
MKTRQALFLLLVAAVLVFLVYLQVQHWRKFDWGEFIEQTNQVRWGMVVAGIAMIYIADALRAWRWAIFLRPVRKVEPHTLIGTQFIGFTGLALLGRLGELIRPYLVARKLKLTFSSQMAVWSVERIFDTGAVAVLISFALFSSRSVKHLEHYQQLPRIGIALVLIVLAGIVAAALLRRFNALIAQWIKSAFKHFPTLGERLASKVVAFGEGLHTLHDAPSFFASTALSLAIWVLVSLSYFLITHAYPAPLNALTWTHAVILMGFSVAGGVLQLPMVGGGSQFMTITALTYFYLVPNEMAVNCGILLWLSTFMSVIPMGFIYAHLERVSFTQLTRESQKTEESLAQ